jgi:hypothetical protein
MNLGFTNDRALPKRDRRKAFDSPSGSSLKETELSFDPRLEDRCIDDPDYSGDISQSSWENDIECRRDLLVAGMTLDRERRLPDEHPTYESQDDRLDSSALWAEMCHEWGEKTGMVF